MENTPQYPQSANDVAPSYDQSSVAPAQSQQVYESVPGSGQVPDSSQPGDQNAPVQEQAAPQVDYQARLRELEAERNQYAQQKQQYEQVFQQIKQHQEQQNAEKERNERVQGILAMAENLPPGEATTYLRNQFIQLQKQEEVARQQAVQRVQQEARQAIEATALPAYADDVIAKLGLPKEAKGELLALGSMDAIYRSAGAVKARWDQYQQMQQQLQQFQQQNVRSNEVNAMRQNGLTNIGGQSATGFNPSDLPSDPNERAMAIYEQLQARRAGM